MSLKASISPTITFLSEGNMRVKDVDEFEDGNLCAQYLFEVCAVASSCNKKPEELTDIDIARARRKLKKQGADLSMDLWK